MGQKVHPIGFRLGYIKTWNSRWFARKQDFARFLHEDLSIRKHVLSGFGQAAIAKVEPEDQVSGEEVRAVARPGRVVQGTVTDQKGRGVKGAQVLLDIVDDDREIDVGLYVYTDEKGFYRFPEVPFGEVTLEVDAGGEWDTAEFEADDRRSPLVQEFTLEAEEE